MRQLPNRYQPLGPSIGGGMSEVIICKDSELDRLVAIKFIPPAVKASEYGLIRR